MAKSDARRTKGQAKPGKERGAPGAVRAGKDVKTGGGSGSRIGLCLDGIVCPTPFRCVEVGGCKRGLYKFVISNDQQAPRYIAGGKPVGMETGANRGGPIGEGAEAKGGECAAGIPYTGPDQDIDELCAKLGVRRSDYDRGLYRAACFRADRSGVHYEACDYAIRCAEQNREAAIGANSLANTTAPK